MSDRQFEHHYEFEVTHSPSEAMQLVRARNYIKCCDIERYHGSPYSQTADICYNGWEGSDWSNTSARTFAWEILTDYDEKEYIVTTEKVEDLSASTDVLLPPIPCIGALATHRLTICRGEEDLPANWRALF